MQHFRLFLQVNELAQDVWWIAGAAVVLVIAFLLTRSYQKQRKTREDLPPEMSVVNDTNYNIDATGTDDDRYADLSEAEAAEVIRKMEDSDQLPSDEEFNQLKKSVK